jgi:hypothetical protein
MASPYQLVWKPLRLRPEPGSDGIRTEKRILV